MNEVEKKYRGEGIISMSFFFSKLRKIWIRVSGCKATKSAKVCKIKILNVHNRVRLFVLTVVVFSMNS